MNQNKNQVNHVALIMDGNGRWAKKRGLPRTKGHEEGCKRIIEIFDAFKENHIKVMTLYAFSTENWNRPMLTLRCARPYPGERLRNGTPAPTFYRTTRTAPSFFGMRSGFFGAVPVSRPSLPVLSTRAEPPRRASTALTSSFRGSSTALMAATYQVAPWRRASTMQRPG